ncbi:MAG: discoidin domain-containing protein [Ignavibacteriales bacterium]|nr:discoidin domain-containing protein [Ignavibacteriales bacterium]
MKLRGFFKSYQINRLSFAVVLFLLLSHPLYATNWYVNKNVSGSNNGTSWTNAWQSFSVINWSSIQPGDYIYISGGTDSLVYNGPLSPNCSGNSVNWITIIAGKYAPSPSGHSGRVIIDGNNHNQSAITFGDGSGSNPSYITIKGIETRNVESGVYANFDNFHRGIKIDSCMIYGFNGAGIQFETGEVGYQNADSVFIENCRIVSPDYIGGESDGIQIKGASRVFINNNYIRIPNQDPVQHVDAIQAYLGNGFVITNNILINDSVYSPEGGGIPIILGSEGSNPVIIYNNFCYMGGVWYSGGNWAGTLMTRWYDHNPMPPTWILNNTVVSNGPRVRGIWLEYSTPTTTTVINNIIAQYSTTTSGVLDNFDNSTGSNLRVDSIRNNLFYHSWEGDVGFGGNVTGNGNTGQPTGWSDWVNNYGGTGVKGNPLLVSNIGHEPDQGLLNGELQSGSPAINQGEDIEWLLNRLNTTYVLNGRLQWNDINGNPRDNTPTIGAYEYDAGPDLTPPRVTGATLPDSITLVVNFSESLDQATAENENNYSITNNINVLSASVSGSKVTLQTSPHSPGLYVVTVVNVEDVAGNSVDPVHNTTQYEHIVLPPDTLMRFPIVDVEGIIIEPNHTPEKTIDGLGALSGDPDSRWAAEPMPEELTFDLGAIRTVCKTKLSFYNWNAGRVYDYSISISSDNNNWITIVSQATSVSNEEWTVEEFSPVDARYVRVHFINNNQSTWAGLWEAEIWGVDGPTVVDPSNNNLPKGFALKQNYPNPFNPSTTIHYSIPSSSFVTLAIYDVLGNEVAILVSEEKSKGSYEVNFSTTGGSSFGGEVYSLTSGIYFYRLQAGSFVDTKKMILLK